jgi:hypothetical protein
MKPSERLRKQAQCAEALARQVSVVADRDALRAQAERLHKAADAAEREEVPRRAS